MLEEKARAGQGAGYQPAAKDLTGSLGSGKELILGKPLSLEARNKIYAEEKAQEAECAICMEKLYSVDFTGMLKGCSHKFCFNCIHKWSETETTCPMCKMEFREVIKDSGAKQMAVDAAYEAEMSGEAASIEDGLRKSKRRRASAAKVANRKKGPVTVKVKKKSQAETHEREMRDRNGLDVGLLMHALLGGPRRGGPLGPAGGGGFPLPLFMLAAMFQGAPGGFLAHRVHALAGIMDESDDDDAIPLLANQGMFGRVDSSSSSVANILSSSRGSRSAARSESGGLSARDPIVIDSDDDTPARNASTSSGRGSSSSSSSSSNRNRNSSSSSSSSSSSFSRQSSPRVPIPECIHRGAIALTSPPPDLADLEEDQECGYDY